MSVTIEVVSEATVFWRRMRAKIMEKLFFFAFHLRPRLGGP